MKPGTVLILLLLAAAVTVVFFFRSGPDRIESAREQQSTPEVLTAPSKENVSRSFVDHLELLKKKLADDPDDVRVLKTLAQWLMDAHKTEEAIIYFERGVRLEPKNDTLLLDLSVCYFQHRQFDKSMEATDQIIRSYPDHARALLNKGIIYAAQNKPDQAAAIWNRVLKRFPGTEEAEQALQYRAQLRQQ